MGNLPTRRNSDGAPGTSHRAGGSVIPSRGEMNRLHAAVNHMTLDGGEVLPGPNGLNLYPSRPVVLIRTSAADGAGANGPFVVSVYANGRYDGDGGALAATATAATAYGPGMPVGVAIVGWQVGEHYEFLSGGVGCTVVKLTSGGPGESYVGDVYGNGPDTTATQTGVTVKVMGMAAGETAVTGRPMLAAMIAGTYYAQVPLWQ